MSSSALIARWTSFLTMSSYSLLDQTESISLEPLALIIVVADQRVRGAGRFSSSLSTMNGLIVAVRRRPLTSALAILSWM